MDLGKGALRPRRAQPGLRRLSIPGGRVWIADTDIALNNYSYHTLTEHLCPTSLN